MKKMKKEFNTTIQKLQRNGNTNNNTSKNFNRGEKSTRPYTNNTNRRQLPNNNRSAT